MENSSVDVLLYEGKYLGFLGPDFLSETRRIIFHI